MMLSLRQVARLATISAVLLSASLTRAGSLTPDPAAGDPHAVGPINGFTVSLIPDPAVYMTSCPWLIPAAESASQPYNKDQFNVWTFNYATSFNGKFTLTQYAATNDGTSGGADFNVDYTPGAGDPTGADVRWMQVIATNMPSSRGQDYGVAGNGTNGIPTGWTAYLDNAGPDVANPPPNTDPNPPIDPYYGWLTATNPNDITTSTAANSTHFLDTPWLPLVVGRIWEAQAFVTKETDTYDPDTEVTTHAVTIYGGVWWGFQVVPEPSTYVLTLIGGGFVAVSQVRKSRRERAAA
jgi:hypothetical protein